MNTPQIEKSVKKRIYNAINSLIDNYIAGKTYGTQHAKSIISRNDYDNYFQQKERTILDFKKEIKKEKNVNNLLKDINSESSHLFNSELEYKNFVRELLTDVVKDRVAEYLDKKEPVITENMKIKNWKQFLNL